MLTLLKPLNEKRDGRYLGLYQCVCGNQTKTVICRVNSGHTKSCGCLKRTALRSLEARRKAGLKLVKPAGQVGLNTAFATYRNNARNRKLSFDLTKEDFASIVSRDCHYCGAAPSGYPSYNGVAGGYLGSGVDRVDNALGYSLSNCVPCCARCNKLKMTLGYYEFLDTIVSIYNHSAKKTLTNLA